MKRSSYLMTFVPLAALLIFSTDAAWADKSHHEKQAVQVETNFTINSGTATTPQLTMFTVPMNEELAIEYFSCNFDVPSGQTVFPSLTTNAGGRAGFTFLAALAASVPSVTTDFLNVSQQVRIFADPGTAVVLLVVRSAAVGGGVIGACSFAGELTNVR